MLLLITSISIITDDIKKSSILDDLEESLRTLLCRACNIVAKRLTVRRQRSAMVLLDTAMTSLCRLSTVSLFLQRLGHNFIGLCKVAACNHRLIAVLLPSVDCMVRYSSVTITCM